MIVQSQAVQWELGRPFLSLSVKYLWFVCVLYKYSVIPILDSSSCSKFPNFEIGFRKPSSSDGSEIENYTQTKIEVHKTSWKRRSCIWIKKSIISKMMSQIVNFWIFWRQIWSAPHNPNRLKMKITLVPSYNYSRFQGIYSTLNSLRDLFNQKFVKNDPSIFTNILIWLQAV